MTRKLLTYGCGLALLATGAYAQNLLVYDAFDYSSGSLDGLDGGAGFDGAWVGVNQPSGLYSYWAFENVATDAGPALADGTLMGPTPAYSTDTPAALTHSTASLSLTRIGNTSGDWCDLVPHAAKYTDLRTFTFSCWVKQPIGQGGANNVFSVSKDDTGSKEVRVLVEAGIVLFDVRGDVQDWGETVGASPIAATTLVNDGGWHHIVVTVTPDDFAEVWVDGMMEARDRKGGFRHVFDLNSAQIGRNRDDKATGEWFFNGLIDDAALWASPLSSTDIAALFAGTAPSTITGTPTVNGPGVSGPSLDSAAFGTFGLVPYGNALRESAGSRVHRLLPPSLLDLRLDTTYYVSCLMRREDNGGTPTGARIDLSDGNSVRGTFGWDETGAFLVGLNAPTVGPVIMAEATTYFCVMRLDAVSSGDDTAYLKVFAPGDTLPASDAGFSGMMGTGPDDWAAIDAAASGAQNDQLLLSPFGRGSTIVIDELRIGTTWESVTSLTYGTACFGAHIGRTGRPALGAVFAVDLSGGTPNKAASLLLGWSRETIGGLPLPVDLTPYGAIGCSLLTDTALAFPTTTDGSGNASMNVAVAADPGTLSLTPFAQWSVLDMLAPNPLALSEGLEIVIEK